MSAMAAKMPSNRNFGWLFSGIAGFASVYFCWKIEQRLSITLGAVSFLFALTAVVAPNILEPLNRLWFQLSLFLGKVVSPIFLGIIFFIVIVPVAILMRIFGRDALMMKKREVLSYWVDKEPSDPDAFRNQF